MDIEWENECKRCGIGCTHDYCHDCQMLGYDPSLSNHKNSENIDTSINKNTISNGGCVVPLRKECGVGVKKNKLICIGYTGLMKCYLNITEREAIQRYIKDENISETQMEMDNDIQINHIEFDDEFGAYSVWE